MILRCLPWKTTFLFYHKSYDINFDESTISASVKDFPHFTNGRLPFPDTGCRHGVQEQTDVEDQLILIRSAMWKQGWSSRNILLVSGIDYLQVEPGQVSVMANHISSSSGLKAADSFLMAAKKLLFSGKSQVPKQPNSIHNSNMNRQKP